MFRKIARILKAGGRLAVSDIALKKPLPEEIGKDLMAYVGCIAGSYPDRFVQDSGWSSSRQIKRERMRTVDRRTTLVILGDGRTSYTTRPTTSSGFARAPAPYWLCPEARGNWRLGDSAMYGV